MNDVLPKNIEFLFINKRHQIQSDLIVFFILKVPRKNDYYIRSKTDKDGRINLERGMISYQISRNMKDFPMDYSSTLEECTIMEIRIETKEELENKIISMENYYPEEALLFKNEMNACRNNQMNFFVQVYTSYKKQQIYHRIRMIFRTISIEIFCLSRCGFRVFIIKNDFFGEEFCGFEMFGIRFGRD